jgi:acyl dehydratase
MPGLYFEQFHVGQTFEHALSRTVTETDNVLFSTMTMNPQPLHLDAEFSKGTEFGRPLVNSIFTLGLLIGMTVGDTTLGTTIGNLGMKEVAFPKPVFHGDTIRARTEVRSVRASSSRPGAGIVEFLHTATNQRDEVVATCLRAAFMLGRP